MSYKRVGVSLDLLSKQSLDIVLTKEFENLQTSFLFHGTLKSAISRNRKVFKDSQRGQNGKSKIAKSIIDNGFVLPEKFISAKLQISSHKL